MNLTEQLKDNFEIIPTDPKADFKRITGEPQFTYDKAVLHIIQKLKDLGYTKLPLAFRPLPYIVVENCEYVPVVAVVKDCEHNFKPYCPLGEHKDFEDDYEKCTKCGLITTRKMAKNHYETMRKMIKKQELEEAVECIKQSKKDLGKEYDRITMPKKKYQEIERKYEDDEPRWVNEGKKPIL